MFDLCLLFKPITAQPFHTASEVHSSRLPCNELKQFVASFWGSERPTNEHSSTEYEPSLIIPDACVDIIFTIDHTAEKADGRYCGIYDRPSIAHSIKGQPNVSRFAIRFYFWAVQFFSDNHMRQSYGASASANEYFPDWIDSLQDMLIHTKTLEERAVFAEQLLLKSLNNARLNNNVMNALYYTISSRGTSPIKDLCDHVAVGQRHLERLYMEHIGMTIKKTTNLIRYQNLWYDIAYSQITSIQDAVEKYHYTDQSHLLNDFKKYHTVTPGQAILIAAK